MRFVGGPSEIVGGPSEVLGLPRRPNPSQIKPKSNQNRIESKSNQNPDRILIEILGNPNTRIGNPRKSKLESRNPI